MPQLRRKGVFMSKTIITISRQHGSGGRAIGEEVARRLGYEYLDEVLITEAAERTGLAKDYIKQKSEYSLSTSIFSYAFVSRDQRGYSIDDLLFNAQRDIINEAADKGPCVIVGRSADYILRNRPNCLNIFVHASHDFRAERLMKLFDLSRDEALKEMKTFDKKRAINYKYVTDRNWGEARNYGICLSSSFLGMDKCIDLICEAAK